MSVETAGGAIRSHTTGTDARRQTAAGIMWMSATGAESGSTRMTAKEYLLEIRRKKKIMLSLMSRCEELRHQAEGVGAITYDKDKVQVSPEDRMGRLMAQLVDLEKKYAQSIVDYHEAIQTRAEQIEAMDNPVHSEILRLRYLEDDKRGNQMRLEEIAYRMNRSFAWVAHLHGQALEEFRKKYL